MVSNSYLNVNHNQVQSRKAKHSKPKLNVPKFTKIEHGQSSSIIDKHSPTWETLAKHGQPWPIKVNNNQPWSTIIKHGKP